MNARYRAKAKSRLPPGAVVRPSTALAPPPTSLAARGAARSPPAGAAAEVQGHEAAADGLQQPPLLQRRRAVLRQPLVLEEAQQQPQLRRLQPAGALARGVWSEPPRLAQAGDRGVQHPKVTIFYA